MPKVEITMPFGRTRSVNLRVAELLVKKGRGAYQTKDLRAEAPPVFAPPAAVAAPEPEPEVAPVQQSEVVPVQQSEVVPVPEPVVALKSTVSTAEAKARREASKRT